MAVLRGWIHALIPHGSGRPGRSVACRHLAAAAEKVCLQTAGASGVPREQWDLPAQVLLTYTVAIRGIVMVREASRQ
jgi:hypothetical protein